MCYRENNIWPILDLSRTLLTPARSHIWPVNKLTRKKRCTKLLKLPRAHNEHVPWFHDPMLSKWTCTIGVDDNFCPYSQQILELVGGGIFFTSFYNWAKIQIISTHGHWLHVHTIASLHGHVLSRQSAWNTLHCCKSVQKHFWVKLHTFARRFAVCFIITIIKISPTLFSLVGSEFDPNGCENQSNVNILITYSLWIIAFLLLTLPHCSAWMVAIFKWTMSP